MKILNTIYVATLSTLISPILFANVSGMCLDGLDRHRLSGLEELIVQPELNLKRPIEVYSFGGFGLYTKSGLVQKSKQRDSDSTFGVRTSKLIISDEKKIDGDYLNSVIGLGIDHIFSKFLSTPVNIVKKADLGYDIFGGDKQVGYGIIADVVAFFPNIGVNLYNKLDNETYFWDRQGQVKLALGNNERLEECFMTDSKVENSILSFRLDCDLDYSTFAGLAESARRIGYSATESLNYACNEELSRINSFLKFRDAFSIRQPINFNIKTGELLCGENDECTGISPN